MCRTSVVSAVPNRLRRLLVVAAATLTLPALAVVAGGTPNANAFSREGLPVEYLDVYSTSMGRNIRVQVSRIVANGTRLWIYCAPGGSTPLDDGADPNRAFNANSLEGIAIKSNNDFQEANAKAGGNNATFEFPPAGNHAWAYWGRQLTSLKPDLIAILNG
jgi:S-formylglutathione hydrolase FrmB